MVVKKKEHYLFRKVSFFIVYKLVIVSVNVCMRCLVGPLPHGKRYLWMDGFTNMVLEPDFSSVSCV